MKTKHVSYILTHPGFHFDEGKAIFILKEYGETEFPGIGTARIVYDLASVVETENQLKNWSAEQLHDELGILCVGCLGERGAIFDEHGKTGSSRKSAAMLVAEFLAVTKKPELRDTLRFVDYYDQNGHNAEQRLLQNKAPGRHASALIFANDVRASLRDRHKSELFKQDEIMDWLLEVIKVGAVVAGQEQSNRNFLSNEAQTNISAEQDSAANIFVVSSDKADLPRAAMYLGASVVVIFKSDGGIAIVSNKKYDLTDVVVELRKSEAALLGKPTETATDLSSERCESVPYVHFSTAGNILCDNAKRVVKNRILTPHSGVVEIVKKHLKPK